jgi:hypothetical protein
MAHQASSTARRVRSSESGIRCPYVERTRVAFSCPMAFRDGDD